MANEAQVVNVRIPEDLLGKIDQLADKHLRNRSNMIVFLLNQAVEAELSAEKAQ